MNTSLFLVSVPVVSRAEHLQIFRLMAPMVPEGVDVIDLQVPSGTALSAGFRVLELTAGISLENESFGGRLEMFFRKSIFACEDLGVLALFFIRRRNSAFFAGHNLQKILPPRF